MLGFELGQAALVGLIALTLPSLPDLLVLVALASPLATLFATAGQGALPSIVAGGDIPRANGLLGSSEVHASSRFRMAQMMFTRRPASIGVALTSRSQAAPSRKVGVLKAR